MPLLVPLPKRKTDSHKGDYGHVCVLGGSLGLTGAVCLAAGAALRSGAGLVSVAVAASLATLFEIKLTEVMTIALPDQGKGHLCAGCYGQIRKTASCYDVFALGCGASRDRSVAALLRKLVKELDKPMVVDADALNAVSQNLNVLKSKKTEKMVLTPHPGEFSRLIGLDITAIKKDRKGLAKKFALEYNLTLVLKGDKTLVTDGERLYENTTGNPGMATAGSGDVLTGILSALLAQGCNCFEAACLGVYLHGLAGDRAAGDKTEYCLTAGDIIDYLPRAFADYSKGYRRRSSIGRASHL